MNIRIGKTPYLNALPFYNGLSSGPAGLGIDFIEGAPAALNQSIRGGNIDISLVSSLEYSKAPDQYFVLPDLSISARQKSQSVGLVWKGSIELLKGREIFFTCESMSSVALLDILLKERFEIWDTALSPVETVNQERIVAEGGPLLVIGDEALILRRSLEGTSIQYRDLSTLWWEWMRKPFCFALWIVRRDFYEKNREAVRRIGARLKECVKMNLTDVDQMLKTVPPLNGIGSREYLKDYLLNFDYGLDRDILQGLYLFYERAAKLGWASRIKDVEFIR